MPRKSIQLSIPTPCHEDWDKMTPCEQGRHCAHCSKTVIDFTAWSDTALYEFFTRKQEHVCGRFLSTQLNRPIHIPPQPHSRLYRMVIAMGLTLIFAQGTDLHAQTKAPLTEQSSTLPTTLKKNTDTVHTGIIKGILLDENKLPVSGAVIQVLVRSEWTAGCATGIDGRFRIDSIPADTCTLLIHNVGYISMRLRQAVAHDSASEFVINMIPAPHNITTGVLIYETIEPDPPGTHIFNRQDINRMPIR